MIGLPSGVQVWLCAEPTNMRCGVDGLAALVQGKLSADPYSGQLFIFRGRKGHIVKCLWSDPEGMCLLYKRLHEGQFVWTRTASGTIAMTMAQLSMLLEGMDWRRIRRPKEPDPDAPGPTRAI
jgi:transposase